MAIGSRAQRSRCRIAVAPPSHPGPVAKLDRPAGTGVAAFDAGAFGLEQRSYLAEHGAVAVPGHRGVQVERQVATEAGTDRRKATETAPSDVAVALAQLSRVVECIMTRVAERLDLTPVQARLLCVLGFGPRVMSDLARGLGVEKAGLTGLVDRAQRRGLVQRTPVPEDRRALQITLTEAGRQAGEAFHAEVTAALDELVAPLAPRVHEQFGRALTEILTAASLGAFDQCMTALPELMERKTGTRTSR